MKKTTFYNNEYSKALLASLAMGLLLISSSAHAFNGDQSEYQVFRQHQSQDQFVEQSSAISTQYNVYAQNRDAEQSSRLRSQSEVVREVKRKYNAEVLKISLNKQRTAYRVRVLMPNGRVRDITVSAYQ